jgi:AcrR family transcriptional regulator
MRKLAQSLGVEAMSLYHHVANKTDILDGMVDLVFAEVELPSFDIEWVAAMSNRATSLRAALQRHPWAVTLMDSRTSPGPFTLRHHDAVIGCCLHAGFSMAMTAHAFALMDSYIHGFVVQEVNLPFDEDADMDAMVAMIVPQLADYPHLAQFTAQHVLQPGYRFGNEFAFGLNLILNALDAERRR